MRFLHTSDWHLGRSFHGQGTLEVQRAVLDELTGWVREHRVDVVLVAGDVYDQAQPRAEVVELLGRALADLRAAGARLVLTSGNHDSAARLGFGGPLLEPGGVHLRTRVEDVDRPVVLPDPAGGTVLVYGVPYLEPRAVAGALDAEPDHPSVTAAALDRVRADAARRRTELPGPVAVVVLAHTFASGAAESDSERDLNVGGLGTVPPSVFAGADYTALGHLHRRQAVTDTVRYSGSPVAYSFSEAGHAKGAWLVDLEPGAAPEARALDHRHGHRLARLRGTLAELLADPALAVHEDALCQVVLTDEHRPPHPMDTVRSRFPRTLELRFEPAGAPPERDRSYAARVARAESPLEVCSAFYEHVRRRPVADDEARVLGSAVESVRAGEAPA
ncbi:exonuclease SbcCD subunit D [Kocuria sabuli]|uniref:exonuclease SbcCD subunit D n=1 Tax=Kocuria sabuli TaxID=3071448 RepID=UPI0034D3D7DC